MVRQKLSEEEKKARKKESGIRYREKNKEIIKERNNKYQSENKGKIKLQRAAYYKKNSLKLRQKQFEYRTKNKNRDRGKGKQYYLEHYLDLKKQIYEILGNKCVICGITNNKFLTVDHINNDGAEKRKKYHGNYNEWMDLKKRGWPIEEIRGNYRILCWNHNCSMRRGYLNDDPLNLNKNRRWGQKLWREAFAFFGPCHCGETELKFLTISHIHDDGAKRRRNGETTSSHLLSVFRGQGWPKSLKEDFCLECFNCNCGRADAKKEGL
jgi:hypothetical protein